MSDEAPRQRTLRFAAFAAGLRLQGTYVAIMTRADADAYAQRLADSLRAPIQADIDDGRTRLYAPAATAS